MGKIVFFFKLFFASVNINWCVFWPNLLVHSSSIGRTSDFGSGGPCSNGVPGKTFFFLFFAKKFCPTPPSGQNKSYKCIFTIKHLKMWLKTHFCVFYQSQYYWEGFGQLIWSIFIDYYHPRWSSKYYTGVLELIPPLFSNQLNVHYNLIKSTMIIYFLQNWIFSPITWIFPPIFLN